MKKDRSSHAAMIRREKEDREKENERKIERKRRNFREKESGNTNRTRDAGGARREKGVKVCVNRICFALKGRNILLCASNLFLKSHF